MYKLTKILTIINVKITKIENNQNVKTNQN